MFGLVRQVAAPVGGRVARTEAMSAMPDCFVLNCHCMSVSNCFKLFFVYFQLML